MREEKIGLGALLGDRDLRTLLYLEGHRAENMRDPYWPVTFGIPRPQFCAATAVTPSIICHERSGLDAGLRACVRNRHPRLRAGWRTASCHTFGLHRKPASPSWSVLTPAAAAGNVRARNPASCVRSRLSAPVVPLRGVAQVTSAQRSALGFHGAQALVHKQMMAEMDEQFAQVGHVKTHLVRTFFCPTAPPGSRLAPRATRGC